MNQKQRDYLIKRLEKIKDEKIASIDFGEPDPEPFIKKLKTQKISTITDKMDKEFYDIDNRIKSGSWSYGRSGKYTEGKQIEGLSVTSSVNIKNDEYFTNLKEVRELYETFCKDFYKVEDERTKTIGKEYVLLCDEIIFAEDYTEAARLIEQFLKF